MKASFGTVVVVAVALFTRAEVRSADWANADHLSPVDYDDQKTNNYRALLKAKLGVSPFDCGRVVDSSSLGPEGVLSVWSKTESGRSVYRVTTVVPEENLWQLTKSMREPHRADAVAIRRIDADIPPALAEEIRRVSTALLRDVRAAPPLKSEFVIAGYLQFFIQRPGELPLEGEVWLPPPGPKTQALVNIYNDLWQYCKASPAERAAIATKIDSQAKWLLGQLK